MLSEKQFKFLRFLLTHKDENFTQRQLAEQLDISLGTVNNLLKECKEEKWISEENHLTDLGEGTLAPYQVKNAIIMVAGMSSRFAPLSYELPKGLLQVKGERLIEREIKQLQEAGIEDITVIVGYLQGKNVLSSRKIWC